MPFDPQASFTLYRQILAPVENSLTGKPRLSLVLDGALTSLPPQLLVMRDPTGKAGRRDSLISKGRLKWRQKEKSWSSSRVATACP
jgi:hypothetical protein